MATKEEVQAAIKAANVGGCLRTTLGVVTFTCGCCGRSLTYEEYDGGVWTSWAKDRRIENGEHVLICKACGSDPEWMDREGV